MLNRVKWRCFKLDDLFDIKISKSLNKNQLVKKDSNCKNNIKYITRSSQNNGFDNFYLNLYDEEYINEGNCISVAMVGESLTSFYQKDSFITSQNIAILRRCKLSMYHYMFLIPILEMDKYRYSYGRTLNLRHLKNTYIKLPIDSDGNPNWEFMEEYMKKISKGNLEGFNFPKNDTRLSLGDREWSEFGLCDLFELERGKRLTKKDRVHGNVPFITAGELNQGVAAEISRNIKGAAYFEKRYLTIDMFGNAFARNYDFGADDNIYVLHNKNLNHTSALFVATVINQNKYRYGYGRQCRMKNIDFIVKLPIKPKSSQNEKSEPDWEFMEDYIKGLPYTKKL